MRFDDILKNQKEIDAEQDIEVAFYSDLRRHRVTLEHINRLRKLHELRDYENKQRLELVKKMYGRPPATIQLDIYNSTSA